MPRRRNDEHEEDDRPKRRSPKSWSTRLAWGVLVVGAGLIVARMSVATVVKISGDGMAPTILDGDHVLIVRGRWTLDRGDVVVYDPTPGPLPEAEAGPEAADPDGGQESETQPDARRDPDGDLRNTAVVELDELEKNWQRVQRKSDGLAATIKRPRAFRLGRILALPGDRVTFNVPESPLGIAVNDEPVAQKPGEMIRVVLRGEPDPSEDAAEVERPRLRATAFEVIDDRRYQVLVPADAGLASWTALDLPPAEMGPVQVHARGYLVLADNRDEGSCCDSRAIGWVTPTHVRGEVLARLGGDPNATPDLAPESRGLQWLP